MSLPVNPLIGEIVEITPKENVAANLSALTLAKSKTPAAVSEVELLLPTKPIDNDCLDGTADLSDLTTMDQAAQSCNSASPLIKVVSPDELPSRTKVDSTTKPKEIAKKHGLPKKGEESNPKESIVQVSMVYDEYGTLVDESTLHQQPKPEDLNVTQVLRLIKKAYHHDLRKKISQIFSLETDSKTSALNEDGIWNHGLTSWDYRPTTPDRVDVVSPGSIRSNDGENDCTLPRVLEIGCGGGTWCFNFKDEQPTWTIEGLDDTDHWSCINKNIVLSDFMLPKAANIPDDYINRKQSAQKYPEFTVRNINCIIAHQNPFPHNMYEFIRAREIFDRVESYKTFLEDIRLILKPSGIVEFLEIDPRPRLLAVRRKRAEDNIVMLNSKQKSQPQTNWTDIVQDRFKDPFDEELATNVPGWAARVDERLKAVLRPRDGVAAANLKSWLEGAGFWDVKQLVLPIPVGGETRSGKLLLEFLLYQIELENAIPKLKEELPAVEMLELESGTYYLNLHIVTGRKPHSPRPGDLLKDGTREDMTASKYDAMARNDAVKASHWTRYDLESNLPTMIEQLTKLPGAPESFTLVRSSTNEKLLPLLGQRPGMESPFTSPPFSTMRDKELRN